MQEFLGFLTIGEDGFWVVRDRERIIRNGCEYSGRFSIARHMIFVSPTAIDRGSLDDVLATVTERILEKLTRSR